MKIEKGDKVKIGNKWYKVEYVDSEIVLVTDKNNEDYVYEIKYVEEVKKVKNDN